MFFLGSWQQEIRRNIHVIPLKKNQAVRMRPSKAEPWGDEQLDWALDSWTFFGVLMS